VKTQIPRLRDLFSQKKKIRNRARASIAPLTKPILSLLVAASVVTLAIGGIRQLKGWQGLELSVYDQFVRSLPQRPQDKRLLIVAIDEEDLQEYQGDPLGDAIVAQVLQKLQKHQPKVIGLDIHRDLPQPPGTELLRKELQAANIVVIATGGNDDDSETPPPPGIPRERVGFSDLQVDLDNVVRRNFLAATDPSDPSLPPALSFPLRIALKYLDNPPLDLNEQTLTIGSAKFPRLQPNSGSYQLEDVATRGWQTMINYHSAEQIAQTVSVYQLLNSDIPPNWITDKIVLIGYTAPSTGDVFSTPYSGRETSDSRQAQNYQMPGVMIHAQIVSQIINTVTGESRLLSYLPEGVEWLTLALASLLGGVIGWRSNRIPILVGGTALAILTTWGMGFFAFSQFLWLPIVPLLLGLTGTEVLILVRRAYHGFYHDSLTNLPNRRAFVRYLENQSRKKSRTGKHLLAVLLIDLDRFKIINEGLGNQAGDELLRSAAQRLQTILPINAQLARVGNDEFAICVFQVQNTQDIDNLVKQIQEYLKGPFTWQDEPVFTSASVGITYQRQGDDFTAEELYRDAAIAISQAQKLGNDSVETFRSSMKSVAEAFYQTEKELREAIEGKEFKLYYQPIISLKTGKIAGFEALIRWPSSKKGFISPSDFIPIAEETGLIIPLGQWILAEACEQIKKWHKDFPKNPPLIISINLSSRQFNQPDLVPQIQTILESIKVEGHSLKLEITESMMMNNVENAIALLRELKELGLRLSIDDFGTGYSNLSYLHRFPVDTLKVDQSFVRQMYGHEDSDKYKQIVRTVIMLGHNLGLDVIAEGIETEEQRQALQQLDCEYGQGFLFSKPLPQEQITQLLQQDPQW
jgi:diguanylate cyclase (GGDEF)-like protein